MAQLQVVGSLLAGYKLPDGRQWGAGAPGNGGQWGRSSRGVALSAWPRRLDLISCASGVHPDRDGGRVRTACGISARDGRLSHRTISTGVIFRVVWGVSPTAGVGHA